MKYGIASDLHINHYSDEDKLKIVEVLNKSGADHLLIAGDISNGTKWHKWFFDKLVLPYTWVKGNHDYYHETLDSNFGTTQSIAFATLWTNFRLNYINEVIAQRSISDFKWIETNGQPIVTSDLKALFYEHLLFLKESRKPIIMTHFPPSIRSEHAMYAGDPLNPYFINNIPDDELKEFGAKLWVHGHVHSKFSYKIGDMQVECNPLGYPKENYSRVEDYPVVLVDI